MLAEPLPRDPGLQPERTALSWNRTGLLIAVNALLSLRTGASTDESTYLLVAAALFVAAALTVVYGALRRRRLAQAGSAPPAWALGMITLVTFLGCGAGIASVVL